MADAAEREEKSAIEASPCDPPEGFAPVDSALPKYEDNPFDAIDTAIEHSSYPNPNTLFLHQPDMLDTLIGQLTVALRAPRNSRDSLRHSEPEALSSDSREGGRETTVFEAVGNDGEENCSYEGAIKNDKRKQPVARNRRATIEFDSQESIEYSTVADGLLSNSSRRYGGRQTSEPFTSPYQDRPLSNRSIGLAAEPTSLSSASFTEPGRAIQEALGITWRRGRGDPEDDSSVWREFLDETLIDFKVYDVAFNITRKDFKGLDEWTEIPKESGRVSSDALGLFRYPFREYERFSHTKYQYDSEFEPRGDGVLIFERVFHIEMPLLFTEVEQLIRCTTDIRANGLKDGGLRWRRTSDFPPVKRPNSDVENDLPYPDEPLGWFFFHTNRTFRGESPKLDALLSTGNLIADVLGNTKFFRYMSRNLSFAATGKPRA